MRDLQEVGKYTKIINPVNVKINSSNFWDVAIKYDIIFGYKHRFVLVSLVFSPSIQDNTA